MSDEPAQVPNHLEDEAPVEHVDALHLQSKLQRAAANMTARVDRAAQTMDRAAEGATASMVARMDRAVENRDKAAVETAASVTARAEHAAQAAAHAAAGVEARVPVDSVIGKAAAGAADAAERAANTVAARVDEALEEFLPSPVDVARTQPDVESRGPKVSVIVPYYNAEATLHRTLQGIRNQTYRNLEIIVIDDGSTDSGPEEALRVAREDSRVHIIRKANTGVSDTRNVGLGAAKGEWVYFADADDWLVRDCIETLVAYALRYDTDFVIADFYRVAKGLVGHKHGPATGLFATSQFLRYMGRRPANHYFSSLWNKLFKRAHIEEAQLRFDTRISFGEDHVFILEYLRQVDSVALVDKPLYYYIDRENSLVHRGLNVFGVVKMKWCTFWPYLRLFNDNGLYRGLSGRLRVYKYIFVPCMDHFVDKGDVPFEPAKVFGMLME